MCAADDGPIKIGVVSEEAAIVGQAISQGAELAVEIITYDNHSSASGAVRGYQRAVQQDHVSAVVTTFISEVALATEPWSARLHMPTITPAAASDLISKQLHDEQDGVSFIRQGTGGGEVARVRSS
ncbi:MAG TPA: ABC transporter substrate-binding protein [Acetobacteraceae bacterium]|nr:ABC transporter substrate-binding protein [Acetobacteraceae bacterium]